MKPLLPFFLTLALLLSVGCKPKEVPAIQRKEAANLASEAQFALTMRDYKRAEPLYEKAAKLCPDMGEYWVNLGVARKRQANKPGAKSAYEGALTAYHNAYAKDSENSDAVLQEIYVLALLGRGDEAKKALEKAQKKLPNNRAVRAFAESHQLDRILEDATFKEIAL